MRKLKLMLSLLAVLFIATAVQAKTNKVIGQNPFGMQNLQTEEFFGYFDFYQEEDIGYLILPIKLYGTTDVFGVMTVTTVLHAVSNTPVLGFTGGFVVDISGTRYAGININHSVTGNPGYWYDVVY